MDRKIKNIKKKVSQNAFCFGYIYKGQIKEVKLMSKRIAIVALVLCICIPVAATAISDDNNIEPQYRPLEASLSPSSQNVYTYDPEARITGEWTGGQSPTYDIYIDYGDGTGEHHTTSNTSAVFYHRYPIESGGLWVATLTVTNGGEEVSDSVVVRMQ